MGGGAGGARAATSSGQGSGASHDTTWASGSTSYPSSPPEYHLPSKGTLFNCSYYLLYPFDSCGIGGGRAAGVTVDAWLNPTKIVR